MKAKVLFTATLGSLLFGATSYAQTPAEVIVEETTVVVEQPVECKTHYSSSWRDNWFIQLGAGAQVPFTEKYLTHGDAKHHVTAAYNVGFGHWFSPYLGFRISGMYGKMRYDWFKTSTAQMATANADLMWDMTTSCCGVNPKRVFSFIPFVGIGGTYTWDYDAVPSNILDDHGTPRSNQWTLPVSAGFQIRLRLCKYVDFFAEARAQFYADNFNGYAQGDNFESNISAIGGLSFNIGERKFSAYNPCDYVGYINGLNNQVNELRGELAATAAALAAANAQLPCPEVTAPAPAPEAPVAPMLTTVRFKINSAVISPEEMVNVYNLAEYAKQNPNTTITIAGYADKDTGSAVYNQKLSERRAQAVKDVLVKTYGISADRLTVKGYGSQTQPYGTNNWNRIVIFTQP